MRQIAFLILLLFMSMFAAGHAQNVDSLVNVFETHELSQTEKILICKDIANAYSFNDIDKSIKYAMKGIALAEKENDKLNLSKFYSLMSIAYQGKARFDTAQIYMEKSLSLAIEIGNHVREINVLAGLGTLNKIQEKFHLAIDYYVKALSRSEEVGYTDMNSTILANIGIIHICLRNNERAYEYLVRSKEIAEKENNLDVLVGVYHALGRYYFNEEKYEQALDFTQQSYDISLINNDMIFKSIALGNLALITEKGFKDYNKALEYALEGLDTAEAIGSIHEIIGAWNVLSNIYREKQMFKESEQAALNGWALDSTSLMEATNFALNITIANINLGNKKRATEFLWKYYNLRDQHSEKNSYDALMDMEVKYETEKKEMRIASLEKERKLYIWLGISGILLIASLVIVLWQTKRNARKEKQLIATRSVLDGEMRERARLAQDLHDRLSGNLSAVKIELGGYADTLQNVRDKLDNCIRDIRDAAHGLMPTSLQSGLKVALADYAAQFPNVRFHFYGQEKRIDERVEFVVYCCASELVNNAVKHSGATNINLQLVQDEKYVTLTVSDNGSGYDEKVTTKGMGLKNIHDRVASCNGKIDISTSSGKGTETTIELKIDKKS